MATGPITVVNELLCFTFHYYAREHSNCIKETLGNFYEPETVNQAKLLLWEHYRDSLPTYESRRLTRNRSVKDIELDDILNSVKAIDGHYSDKNLPVTFAAVDLMKMPTMKREVPQHAAPNDQMSSMEQRLKLIERQLTELLTTKLAVGENKSDTPEITKAWTGGYTGAQVIQQREDAISKQPLRVALPPIKNSSKRTVSPEARENEHRQTPARNQHHENTNDPDEYQPVRRRRSKHTFGNRKSDLMKAGPRLHHVFIYGIDKDVSVENITSFIETSGTVKVRDTVCQTTRMEQPTRSYHVTLECDDITTVLNSDFWPERIGFRRFRLLPREKNK